MYEINKSKIHGDGIIAVEHIGALTTIGALTWPYITDAYGASTNLAKNINHSWRPNAVAEKVNEGSMYIYYLIANEDIKPGEEITLNYNDLDRKDFGPAEPWYK
jgi:hypothetical protein